MILGFLTLLATIGLIWGFGACVGYYVGRLEAKALFARELQQWVVAERPFWPQIERHLQGIIEDGR